MKKEKKKKNFMKLESVSSFTFSEKIPKIKKTKETKEKIRFWKRKIKYKFCLFFFSLSFIFSNLEVNYDFKYLKDMG